MIGGRLHYTVLIVEDYPALQELLEEYLEFQGMVVWTASSCSEALALLKQFRPEIILSELEFVDGNVRSLLKQWREHESRQGWGPIPAIVISRLDWGEHECLTDGIGFQAYIRKPFAPSYLLAVINLMLDKKKRG